jgi:type I restriction enzyme S subunit
MIRYVDVSAVSRETLAIAPLTGIATNAAPSRARKIVQQDDTIFATIRPTLKRVAKVPAELDDEIVSTAFCVLRPDKTQIEPDYLFFLVSSDGFVASVAEHETGASYPAVRDRDVLDQEVKIPALQEQQDISKALNLLRASILNEIELLRVTEELKRATMTHLFTRGLRGEAQKETGIGLVPESWALDLLGAHHTVVSGGTPSRSNPAFWTGGTTPWVKTTEVDYCVVSETEEHITQQGLENSAAKMLPVGTLLMAMYGQGVTRGKVAILGIEATCNQACAAITPNDDAVHPHYLYHFLAWRYEAIRLLAHGGQQQNLNLEIVRDLPLAYPQAFDEQREIITLLDALDRKITLHRQKRAVLEELFKSLLHKLITGEIRVDQLDLSVLPAQLATEGTTV